VAQVGKLQHGDKVLDTCAAPGGKTTHFASYLVAEEGGLVEALDLLRQDLEKPLYFYYGNNQTPAKAWPAVWDIKALPELINIMLDAGVGGGCMNCGAGFLEAI